MGRGGQPRYTLRNEQLREETFGVIGRCRS